MTQSVKCYEENKSFKEIALTVVALLVGCHPANQKVADLIPGEGTYLGYGLNAPSLVGALAEGNQSMFLSLSFSLPSPLK